MIKDLDADLAGRGLALKSRYNAFSLLRRILEYAVKDRLLDLNPAQGLELCGAEEDEGRPAPRGSEERLSPLGEGQAETYIQTAGELYQPRVYGGNRRNRPMPYGTMLPLMATGGFRVGEVYRFEWADFHGGPPYELEVRQAWDRAEGRITPKSKAAYRIVPVRIDMSQRLLE